MVVREMKPPPTVRHRRNTASACLLSSKNHVFIQCLSPPPAQSRSAKRPTATTPRSFGFLQIECALRPDNMIGRVAGTYHNSRLAISRDGARKDVVVAAFQLPADFYETKWWKASSPSTLTARLRRLIHG